MKQKQPSTIKKFKEYMDFIYPLVKELPVTDIRRNSVSDRYERVTKKDIYALVNRGKSWVDKGCEAMSILEKLDLNSPQCKRLKKLITGEINEVYGMVGFVDLLNTIPT